MTDLPVKQGELEVDWRAFTQCHSIHVGALGRRLEQHLHEIIHYWLSIGDLRVVSHYEPYEVNKAIRARYKTEYGLLINEVQTSVITALTLGLIPSVEPQRAQNHCLWESYANTTGWSNLTVKHHFNRHLAYASNKRRAEVLINTVREDWPLQERRCLT